MRCLIDRFNLIGCHRLINLDGTKILRLARADVWLPINRTCAAAQTWKATSYILRYLHLLNGLAGFNDLSVVTLHYFTSGRIQLQLSALTPDLDVW